MPIESSQIALSVVNQIQAMVAYWDSNQRCIFSNNAYLDWFDRSPEEMVGMMTLQDLLGPSLYEKNLPYILGALRGEKQVFERQIPLPGGGVRESITTYTPDILEGVVRGFSVHVADVTLLREREAALERVIQERDTALSELRTLRGLLPICAGCKDIKNSDNEWQAIETYFTEHSSASFTHGLCLKCLPKYFPGIDATD